MKKFFSFVAAILCAASMMAEDKVVVLDTVVFNDTLYVLAQGSANPGSEVKVVKDGVTLTINKGQNKKFCLTAFAHSAITISAEENIKQIAFEFGKVSGSIKDGGLASTIGVGDNKWESGELPSQARLAKVTITLGEGKGEGEVIEEITPEKAKEIGTALEDNASTKKQYIVKGYVTYAKEYNTQYKNQDFYMASTQNDSKDNFYAFQTAVSQPVEVGNLVTVQGRIMKYKYESGDYSIQIKGGKCTIVESTAINNAIVAEKAVKVIENGQLIVIRNGVKYNAVGAVVE